jgi:hypothetical protein
MRTVHHSPLLKSLNPQGAFTNSFNNPITSLGSTLHFASLLFIPVVTVSASVSKSFNRLNNLSSALNARIKLNDREFEGDDASGEKSIGGSEVEVGLWGWRMYPTALLLLMFLGRTRKDVAPGTMRRPNRSPRLFE